MPVRRGHVAPRTTIIETIIRKFDTHGELLLLLLFLSRRSSGNRIPRGFNPDFCPSIFDNVKSRTVSLQTVVRNDGKSVQCSRCSTRNRCYQQPYRSRVIIPATKSPSSKPPKSRYPRNISPRLESANLNFVGSNRNERKREQKCHL